MVLHAHTTDYSSTVSPVHWLLYPLTSRPAELCPAPGVPSQPDAGPLLGLRVLPAGHRVRAGVDRSPGLLRRQPRAGQCRVVTGPGPPPPGHHVDHVRPLAVPPPGLPPAAAHHGECLLGRVYWELQVVAPPLKPLGRPKGH